MTKRKPDSEPSPVAVPLTREVYCQRLYAHLSAALGEPRPGQYVPFPGDGACLFVNFAALAIVKCSDDELGDLSRVVMDVACKAGLREAAREESRASDAIGDAEVETLNRWFNLEPPAEGGAR